MTAAGLKVIFAGTPEFAALALQALLDSQHQVIAAYTQPDRPAGRGRKLTASPVKLLAQAHGTPVYQPERLKGEAEQQQLRELGADVMVVVAYGLILSKAVLETPRLGCINIHASLLPRWRGAAPIQRAILAGDEQSGVTIMQMDVGLDTGKMLVIETTPIHRADTASTLHDRLAKIGARTVITALDQLQNGSAKPVAQDETQTCYAQKLSKEEALLAWNRPAIELERQVRAFNPWPIAQTHYEGEVMRIWQAQALDGVSANGAAPGSVVSATKAGIDVATGNGVLRIEQAQLPGGRPLAAVDLLNARKSLKQADARFESTATVVA